MFNNRNPFKSIPWSRNIIPNQGDTPLHAILRRYSNEQLILTFIATIPNISEMAKTVNDLGEIPLDLIKDSDSVLYDKVLAITLPTNYSKLSEPIDPDKLPINRSNDKLNENLRLGVLISNYARMMLSNSSTHPEENTFPQEKIEQIDKASRVARKKIDKKTAGIIANGTNNHFSLNETEDELIIEIKLDDNTFEELMNLQCSFASKFPVGDCNEYADLAMNCLNTYYKLSGTKAEIFSIEKGDHIILVMDRDPNSDPTNPSTWGKQAVICDPWIGKVYPASMINNELKTFRVMYTDNKNYNLLLSFNPSYHKVVLHPESEWLNTKTMRFTFAKVSDNELENYLSQYFSSPQEKLNFYMNIFPRVKRALKEGVLVEEQLHSLHNSKNVLQLLFGNQYGLKILKMTKWQLDTFDKILIDDGKEDLNVLLSCKGWNYLKGINDIKKVDLLENYKNLSLAITEKIISPKFT